MEFEEPEFNSVMYDESVYDVSEDNYSGYSDSDSSDISDSYIGYSSDSDSSED